MNSENESRGSGQVPSFGYGSSSGTGVQSYKEMLQMMKKYQAQLDELQDKAIDLQGKIITETFASFCTLTFI